MFLGDARQGSLRNMDVESADEAMQESHRRFSTTAYREIASQHKAAKLGFPTHASDACKLVCSSGRYPSVAALEFESRFIVSLASLLLNTAVVPPSEPKATTSRSQGAMDFTDKQRNTCNACY